MKMENLCQWRQGKGIRHVIIEHERIGKSNAEADDGKW